MNDRSTSRILLPGVIAVFCLALALFIAAGAEVAQAKTLYSESDSSQSGASETASRTIRLEQTLVSGNQELPKVLYIVPWQQPGGIPNIALKAEAPELQVFRRLYPPAYRRELNYYQLLQAADTEK